MNERTLLGDLDLYLFNEGTHSRLYRHLGAHPTTKDGERGVHFAVWAPNAESISLIGDFDGWQGDRLHLSPVGQSGIWGGFFTDVEVGSRYKYRIRSIYEGYQVDKADPFGFRTEVPPLTASVVHTDEYEWHDAEWVDRRAQRNAMREPMSIYECHLGSWRRVPEEGDRFMTYREMAPWLAEHVRRLGFTHVELLPIMEHPFYGSWGYQTTGYFAPSSRFGSPQDFKYLIDVLHQNGIGVILDWVPSHFPTDEHGLVYFDGTHLFEHSDPRQGYHPDWNSAIFNYGRNEVRSFLLSSACYWIDQFHIDGLRVDAVASMLYLDYSRKDGEWIPNRYGGRENIEAMEFLRLMNRTVHGEFPGCFTVAEESTAWPMVSRPTELGGLGFTMKWDMGWMHDTLTYFSKDPVHRHYHHDQLTFRGVYAFNENFVMPLSHDEVVHGKGSLLNKQAGDPWQRMANLRLLYSYMYACSGKKLLFMGAELAPETEWDHDRSLDWHLLEDPARQGLVACLGDLNRLHRDEPALHDLDFESRGFQWIDCNDSAQSVLSFIRRGLDGELVVCVFNFTPMPRSNYRIGVPKRGFWAEIFNGDAAQYGGSGRGNMGGVETVPIEAHGQFQSVTLELPPLAGVLLKYEGLERP